MTISISINSDKSIYDMSMIDVPIKSIDCQYIDWNHIRQT